MGREFELKYAATAADLAILKEKYPHLSPIAMETTYYDTPDGILGQMHWTLRRRMENGRSVCTLKTPTAGLGRGEWEIEYGDIADALPLLCKAGAPQELLVLTAKGVEPVCGARFTRLAGLVEAPGCTVELALDAGVLTGGGKEQSFTEVEVELKSGSEDAAIAFATLLARKMGLQPEHRSKVKRARDLAGLK